MTNQIDRLLEAGLPEAPEAEKFVLASALMSHSMANIAASLRASDFATERHRRIFAAMVHLDESGSPVDALNVVHELRRRRQLDSVDGMSYIASLSEGMPALVNVDSYVSMVRDKAILREAIKAHCLGIEECLTAANPTSEILERAQRSIADLATETRSGNFRTPMEVITRAGGITTFLSPDTRRGIETPWSLLNRMLVGRGFMPGQMVVIGARPSMGKTALACQLADFAASNSNGVAFFTLEMTADAILMRMAAARAQVDSLKVTQGYATPLETKTLSEAFADIADEEQGCRLWIDDTTGCTVPAMRAALRRLTAKHPVKLVVVDYLQLVETSGRSERRYEQVSEISRGMKRIAREFGIPVVVLAQLNREVEKETRKPRPSDLRDSGSIEQDADVILMPALRDGQDEQTDTPMIDLIIAKQRNGPRGKVPLKFLRRYAKFIEAERQAPMA